MLLLSGRETQERPRTKEETVLLEDYGEGRGRDHEGDEEGVLVCWRAQNHKQRAINISSFFC